MVTFDHRESGTLESVWSSSRAWGRLPRYSETIGHLVVVAAHPDDETLGAGGLIETAGRSGAIVSVVVATDGEGSHPGSPTHTRWQLSRIRRREIRKAIDHLDADARIHHCGIADGELIDHVDDLRKCIEEAVAEVDRPATIVAPWAGDGHRDHRAAASAALAAARATDSPLLEYPIWMWHWGSPDDASLPWDEMVAVDLPDDARVAKSSALVEHVSQTAPLSDQPGDEAVIGVEMRSHFERAFEVFFAAHEASSSASASGSAAAAPPAPEGDQATPGADGGGSLGRAFFDRFYAGRTDPWGFESRWYEQRKRAVLLAALPHDRYASAVEVGCSTGRLTAELAERCERLLGVDIAAAPIVAARERLGGRPGVELRQLDVTEEWPEGTFDLIVLSEVAYYWSTPDLRVTIDRAVRSLSADGVIVACHWRHPVAEYPLSGDAVHEEIGSRADLVATVRHLEEDFVLEVFGRPPGASVARESGLLA